MRSLLKKVVPRPVLRLYNRLVSRRRIVRRLGDWFDVEWNRRASDAGDREWLETYDRSWEHWGEQDLSPDDLRRIGEQVGRCATLLDAGCGDGYLLESLAGQADVRYGLDLSGVGLRRARERLGPDIHLVQGFLESLPFEDDAFEVVVSTHVLEHVKHLDKAAAELIRVARRRVIVLVPSQEPMTYTEDYHLHYFPRQGRLLKHFPESGAHCERYSVPPGVCAYQGDVLLLTLVVRHP